MTRRLNALLLAFLLLVGVPCYWLFIDSAGGDVPAKPVTIGQLRDLAEAMPGEKPVAIRSVILGYRSVVGNMVAAGSGMRPIAFTVRAYQLLMPDGSWISVDSGLSPAIARKYGFRHASARNQTLVNRALAGASQRIFLVDYDLHTSGGTAPGAQDLDAQAIERVPHALAPGVVAIPAPGLTRGSRMLYVKLADGDEFLFTGDVAQTRVNWAEVRPPARLMTLYYRPQDRREIVSWLKTIRALHGQAPGMIVVEGHDARAPDAIGRGFILQPPSGQASGISRRNRLSAAPKPAMPSSAGSASGPGRRTASGGDSTT